MKIFLMAIALLSIISFTGVPNAAQRAKVSRAEIKFVRNSVTYASAKAYSDGRGVWLEWKTEFEPKNIGFNVYKISGGERQLVNPTLILGAYHQAQAEKITSGIYSFFDEAGDINSAYVIESYNLNGRRSDSDLIQPQMVEDLATVAGVSSEQFINQSKNDAPNVTRSQSLLPKDLASEVESNNLQSDPITQRWVAAQPGAKIGVKSEGFYRISRAQLETGGFDVNAPTARWQLYANGIEQAIIVGDNGNYIEFYGKGIETTESETQTYFLVVGAQDGKRIGTTLRRRISGSVASENYAQSFIKKERFNYVSSVLNGDVENFFGRAILGNGTSPITFNLSGVDFNTAAASVEVIVKGDTSLAHQVRVKLNTVDIGTVTGSGFGILSQRFNISTSILREGQNSLQLIPLGGSSDITLFDSVKVDFARNYQADQNKLAFFVPNYKTVYAGNFSSPNIRVFDTTSSDVPVLIANLPIEQNNGIFRVNIPSNRGRVLYAVEDTGLSQPAWIKSNTPSTLTSAVTDGELIIISYKDWLAQAENWANYRRAQGMTVKVVDIEDVYDEFNYGVLNADSIRSFLQYAKNNWRTAPGYVLLLGDATYDPRNYTGNGIYNYVPTRLVDTLYSETGSDETLADFNDDGLAEIAIGRIPARDAATVSLALNKVTVFEQAGAQAFNRGAVFGFDYPNGYDFEGLSGRLRDELPSNIPRIMVSRASPDAHTQLITEMNSGRHLINYSGHGNVGVGAGGDFFTSADAAALTNGNSLSVFTMLTCLNGYFIQPTDSMAEILIKNQNGGAVSTWSSSGLTTADVQEVMALRFYNQVAAGNITRLGDLIKDAKGTISFGRDVRLSWVLLGDPVLKVR